MPGPLARLLDRLDERKAAEARLRLGPSGRLLSWTRTASGHWRARLSGPGWPETIEREGRTRSAAIDRARDAFEARVGLARGALERSGRPAPPRTANDIEGHSWP